MKLEEQRLWVVGVDGEAAGDPERQDMQGAKGKVRRGQRWSILCEWLFRKFSRS